MYTFVMPVVPMNPNYRAKFDAFRILDQSGWEPLKQAIDVALQMKQSAEFIEKALDMPEIKPETKAQLTIALTKCLPDQFHAWIKVAEFVYSKPKHLTIDGHVTYEELLAGTWMRGEVNGLPPGAPPTEIR